MTAAARRGAQDGQATVELAVLAPLLVAVVLAAAQLLAVGAARVLADHAAEAGAVALLQGADPAAAARAALPGWSRDRVTVTVRGRQVRVWLRPTAPIAALGGLLTASGKADAGPPPR
jgi:Flp pilus assembly protein TadG